MANESPKEILEKVKLTITEITHLIENNLDYTLQMRKISVYKKYLKNNFPNSVEYIQVMAEILKFGEQNPNFKQWSRDFVTEKKSEEELITKETKTGKTNDKVEENPKLEQLQQGIENIKDASKYIINLNEIKNTQELRNAMLTIYSWMNYLKKNMSKESNEFKTVKNWIENISRVHPSLNSWCEKCITGKTAENEKETLIERKIINFVDNFEKNVQNKPTIDDNEINDSYFAFQKLQQELINSKTTLNKEAYERLQSIIEEKLEYIKSVLDMIEKQNAIFNEDNYSL